MDSYAPLLERLATPQPSFQKLAVIAIFDKIRSVPLSDAGRDAISHCLRSSSPEVVDQATRELCRLVKDSKLEVSIGLMELQSALGGSSNRQLIRLYVKSIGLLTRLGFQESLSSFRFYSSENHPFVQVLSYGAEVQGELVKQIIVFITKCKYLGMEVICEFLGPFLNYSIITIPTMSYGSTFMRNLISTLAAFCCSFPQEAIPIIKLLMGCLKFIQCKNAEDVIDVSYIFECLADAYHVVLRQLVGMRMLVHEAQLCGLEMLDAILSEFRNFCHYPSGVEEVLDISRHLVATQKELGLKYVTELASVVLSLLQILSDSELEHEQYSILRLILFLLQWKSENIAEYQVGASTDDLSEELLFIFPVLALVSSPSGSLKQAAVDVLSILGKTACNVLTSPKEKYQAGTKHLVIRTPGHIVMNFLRNLWCEEQLSLHSSFYNYYLSYDELYANEDYSAIKTWTSSMRCCYLEIVGKHKSTSEISLVLAAITSVLLLHQKGSSAIDLLAIICNSEPKIGVPLTLLILFYNHLFSSIVIHNEFHDMMLKLLGMLPSVASHPAIVPVILQILMPMVVHKDVNPILKATAIRMICKTWEINGRVFGTLQGMLHPNALVEYAAEREICFSIAVSIQDVCRRNPDRGVDIILSVEACIENSDPLVKSLGLQSVAHLCEADVIDFYTAWGVIAQHVQNYLDTPVVSYGLSLFLRWGAMDAEAYPEVATNILNILWDIGTHKEVSESSLWMRAHEAAFTALLEYEVVQIVNWIPDFSTKNMEFLKSLDNPRLLTVLEKFEVRNINYEHNTRRRFVKQKKVTPSGSKIVKLLDVIPDVIFGSGGNHRIRELPGAALFYLPTPKDAAKNQGLSKGLENVHAKFENTAVEISASLKLSRNVFLALLSLQSWKPFMQRWMKSCSMVLEAKTQSTVLEKTSKIATDILKILIRLAETAIPRSAENVALALGAFCEILPASAHAVKFRASEFLLNWLSQYEHEYRQWSAAISLGLISSNLHATDHKQKLKNMNTLLEVASICKSTLVKGACGIGLGFSCHDLLTRVESGANTQFDKESFKVKEIEVLGRILRTLVQLICQFSRSKAGILEMLAVSFPFVKDNTTSLEYEFLSEDIDQLEEDPWGIAGLVIGVGNCLGAIYRAGAHDAVLNLKQLIISWLPSADSLFSESVTGETCSQMLSVGACLVLPDVVSFCHRVELIDDVELGSLVSSFIEFLSGLPVLEQSDTFHTSLLMASCAGAGSLLSIVLNAELHSVEVKHVKSLLELFRRSYSGPNTPFVHLGGMVGVVNVMGAGAGTMVQHFHQKEQSPVTSPVLFSHTLEAELTALVQDIFLVAQNPDDLQLQQYATWTVSFLRHFVFSREIVNSGGSVHNDLIVPKSVQGVAEDSLVMKLSKCLLVMNFAELGMGKNIGTTVFALRCLSHAPRLPSLDWGTVIRRCMKYGGQVAEMPSYEKAITKRTVREECFLFLLSHANQSDSLLPFLDELFDLARFKALEANLQSLMLLHVSDLLRIFSSSRAVKLFDDLVGFFQWVNFSDHYDKEQKISLRISCWKGLQICLDESAIETQDYAYNFEQCMEVLFAFLPWSHSGATVVQHQKNAKLEWMEAIRCLGKARQSWLSDLLQVSDANFKAENNHSYDVLKKVLAKAALVRFGSIPLLELGKLKAYILDISSEVVWNILVEVALALHRCDESVRRQWLVDTAEIIRVTRYPSTALRFLGLLCGSSCKYMPILMVDKSSVLSDLPFTISTLLNGCSTGWRMIAGSVASHLCKSTARIYDWARHVESGEYLSGSQPIDTSESDMAGFLLRVLHCCCISLREHLPVEKQLRIANMNV